MSGRPGSRALGHLDVAGQTAVCITATCPDLDVLYASPPASGWNAFVEAVMAIAPPMPCRTIARADSWTDTRCQ